MAVIRKVPKLIPNTHTFCPGCGHGILLRLISEALEEEGYDDKVVLTVGVGCSCNVNPPGRGYPCWTGDLLQSAHGRASATATGVKVARPDLVSISYQGDGDAYVIGLNETINAAYRNENISVFTVMNNNFAMTGGQMSWTTMPGQKTTTSPKGRDCETTGYPIKVPEIIASFKNVAFVARGTTASAADIVKLKSYVKKAIRNQIDGKGYSLVEVVSPCPTNWGMNVEKSIEWMKETVLPEFPCGILKEGRE